MTPLIIAKRKADPNPDAKVFLKEPFLRFDGQKHVHVPVDVNPEDYQLIGYSNNLEFYKLKK